MKNNLNFQTENQTKLLFQLEKTRQRTFGDDLKGKTGLIGRQQ